jgi:hypothetical protein
LNGVLEDCVEIPSTAAASNVAFRQQTDLVLCYRTKKVLEPKSINGSYELKSQ